MAYKYGVSKIIQHPQGTYRVAYAGPEKKLSHSILLWFKNKKGQYINTNKGTKEKKILQKLQR